MYKNKTFLGIIPARGGSKGIPYKNIQEIAGKPLIAWTILEAKKSKYIDRLILSSEDEKIIKTAKNWGCDVPFIRPKEIAQDDTPGVDPVFHAIKHVPGYEYIVLLQPTSPLRIAYDIDACIELCINRGSNICVSITEQAKNPYLLCNIDKNSNVYPILKERFISIRQKAPKTYIINGAVYVAEIKWLKRTNSFLTPETIGYIMPYDRSIDIDTELDFITCEQQFKLLNK